MVVIVTGAAGFIGSHTCERLLKAGIDVVGIDNVNSYYDVRLKHYNVDLLTRLARSGSPGSFVSSLGANDDRVHATTVSSTSAATNNYQNTTYITLSSPLASSSSSSSSLSSTSSSSPAAATGGSSSESAPSSSSSSHNLSNAKTVVGSFEFVCMDITDAAAVEALFARTRPDMVVHLAARAGVRPSIDDPTLYVQTNIQGTLNLLEAARKSAGMRHFVYASSSSVYGSRPASGSAFAESDPTDSPVSPYAATKKSCEMLAASYSTLYKMPITGLRFFTVYGPRGRPDMAPFKFVHRISNGLPIDRYGDGSSSRDYTFIDDIVDGIVAAMGSIPDPVVEGARVLNLGNCDTVTLSRFISVIEEAVGRKAIVRALPDQPGDVPITRADVTKSARLIGYKPKTRIEEGIRRFVKWYKDEYVPMMTTMRGNTTSSSALPLGLGSESGSGSGSGVGAVAGGSEDVAVAAADQLRCMVTSDADALEEEEGEGLISKDDNKDALAASSMAAVDVDANDHDDASSATGKHHHHHHRHHHHHHLRVPRGLFGVAQSVSSLPATPPDSDVSSDVDVDADIVDVVEVSAS